MNIMSPKHDEMVSKIYMHLRNEIGENRLPTGFRLHAGSLSRQFSTTRYSVLAALSLLVGEGLIIDNEKYGFYVAVNFHDSSLENRLIRESLECAMIKIVAKIIDDQSLALLSNLISNQEKAIKLNNVDEFYRLDASIHEVFTSVGRFFEMQKILQTQYNQFIRSQLNRQNQNALNQKIITVYKKLLKSLIQGDPEQAELNMKEYYKILYSDI